MSIEIRETEPGDFNLIWPIFQAVIKTGDTYAQEPHTAKVDAEAYWMAENHRVFLAKRDNRHVGTYFIRANHPGLASHIANASFMVHPNAQGGGLGRALAQHAMERARQEGFLGMQFNLVVSTNIGALRLWQSLGFEIIGTIPRAFRHPQKGLVDAHIMYRDL